MGRPALIRQCDPSAIIEAVREGAFITDAAALQGVDARAVRRWCIRGRQALAAKGGDVERVRKREREYAQFALDIEQARAHADKESIERIRKRGGIDCDWKSEAWLMVRRNRAKWDPSVREVVAQELESLCDIVRDTLGDEAWATVLDALEESGVETPPGYGLPAPAP